MKWDIYIWEDNIKIYFNVMTCKFFKFGWVGMIRLLPLVIMVPSFTRAFYKNS